MAKKYNYVGSWAFLVGVVLALALGILVGFNVLVNITPAQVTILMYLLIALGVVVGLLNITEKESMPFLVSGLTLVLVCSFGREILSFVPIAQATVTYILMIFVPATIIVAVKNVFILAKN